MKLTLKSSYLSIKSFPEVELPHLTVLTGLNGSGKTHLLRAIKEGHIAVHHENKAGGIHFFDWSTLVPNNSSVYSSLSRLQLHQQAYRAFDDVVPRWREMVITAAVDAGIDDERLSFPPALAAMSQSDFEKHLGDTDRSREAMASIENAMANASRNIMSAIRNESHRKVLQELARERNVPVVALDIDDFFRTERIEVEEVDAFKQSFAKLFVNYRDLYRNNKLAELRYNNGASAELALTDEEFEQEHMPPPWEIANRAFSEANLGFEIDHPDLYSEAPYQPRLTKLSSGAFVKFDDLSSGEKVLMSLALSLYSSQDRRHLAKYPGLLLLDEVDAPLHPSMSQSLIQTLSKVLVGEHGINVILTSHSPSTVAVTPESSLYAMYSDKPGLHKVTKSAALNLLTEGVPTLAFSYEGRRQVFVESPVDAEVYSSAYQILRTRLGSDRSLEFIASGGPTGPHASHVNTGCDRVRKLVGDLEHAGNTSVFGIVDWDGRNSAHGRLTVLAQGKRNGLENLILDPLPLTCLLVREQAFPSDVDTVEIPTYAEFLRLEPGQLQPWIDAAQARVVVDQGSSAPVDYVGGFKLEVDRAYLELDDHQLLERILTAFPKLRALSLRTGQLMKHTVKTVLSDQPTFVPIDLANAFRKILEQPSH